MSRTGYMLMAIAIVCFSLLGFFAYSGELGTDDCVTGVVVHKTVVDMPEHSMKHVFVMGGADGDSATYGVYVSRDVFQEVPLNTKVTLCCSHDCGVYGEMIQEELE